MGTPTPQLLPLPTPLPQLSLTTATPPLPPLTPMADTPMVYTPPSPPGPSTKSATKDTWAYDKLLLWFLLSGKTLVVFLFGKSHEVRDVWPLRAIKTNCKACYLSSQK